MTWMSSSDRDWTAENERLPYLQFRTSPDLLELVELAAASTGLSRSEFARRAVTKAVLETQESEETEVLAS